MDEDVIADFKQFITVTVSQQLALQTDDIKSELKSELRLIDEKIQQVDEKLSQKIDDLSASVADALEASNEAVDHQLKDHETRITKLETAKP